MGWDHTTVNKSEISSVISFHDEYKLPYKLIIIQLDLMYFKQTRVLITKEYVYIEAFDDNRDCDCMSMYYSKKFERKELFENPQNVTVYEMFNGTGKVIKMRTKPLNKFIDPKYKLPNYSEEDVKESEEKHHKSKICKAYLRSGKCKYGNTCKFSHNCKEVLCKFFLAGTCKFGDNCKFKHAK